MKQVTLGVLASTLVIFGSACSSANGMFDVQPEDCEILIADADAEVEGRFTNSDVEAQGKLYLRRGKCNEVDQRMAERAQMGAQS